MPPFPVADARRAAESVQESVPRSRRKLQNVPFLTPAPKGRLDGGGLWARTTRTVRGYGARNHVQYVAPKDLLRPGQRKEAELVRRAGCFRSCMPTLHPPSFQPLQCTESANMFACTGTPSNLCAVDAWSVPDIVRVGFPAIQPVPVELQNFHTPTATDPHVWVCPPPPVGGAWTIARCAKQPPSPPHLPHPIYGPG